MGHGLAAAAPPIGLDDCGQGEGGNIGYER